VRADYTVMNAQADLLSDDTSKQQLYRLLSESIMRTADKMLK
jgi:hypothetical protein